MANNKDFLEIGTIEGRQALSLTSIIATTDPLHFPKICISKEDWGILGVLWLAIDDFILIDLGMPDDLAEAFIGLAYIQQSTRTPLELDAELVEVLNNETLINHRFIDPHGNEINLTNMKAH